MGEKERCQEAEDQIGRLETQVADRKEMNQDLETKLFHADNEVRDHRFRLMAQGHPGPAG